MIRVCRLGVVWVTNRAVEVTGGGGRRAVGCDCIRESVASEAVAEGAGVFVIVAGG